MTGAPAFVPPPAGPGREAMVDAIDAALPQTQCRRCGEPDCRRYAEALADGRAEIDRCPPGGAEGVVRLADITGRVPRPLDAARGREGPRRLAVIDEALCIGCTLCIQACPVDCIVGAAKRMHTVIEAQCTGCELCVPACPVDCIALLEATPGRSGWQAWSPGQAADSRRRYRAREARLARRRREREQRLAARAGRPVGGCDAAAMPAVATVEAPTGDVPGVPVGGASESVPIAVALPPLAVPLDAAPAAAATPEDRKRATIAAALARARERRGS